MKLWVWIHAEIKNEMRPWKNLEKEAALPFVEWVVSKFGNAAFVGRRPTHKKNVYGFLHTRSSDGHQAIIFNVAGRALRARSRLRVSEPVVLVLGVAALHYNTSFRQLLQQATGHHRSGNIQTDFGCVAMNGAGGHTFAQAALFNPLS